MRKTVHSIKADVPVYIVEEDAMWVAFCPSLGVSSYGDTVEEAKEAFEEALEIFLEEMIERNSLEQELIRLGWTLSNTSYQPPVTEGTLISAMGNPEPVQRTVEFPYIAPRPSNAYYAT